MVMVILYTKNEALLEVLSLRKQQTEGGRQTTQDNLECKDFSIVSFVCVTLGGLSSMEKNDFERIGIS